MSCSRADRILPLSPSTTPASGYAPTNRPSVRIFRIYGSPQHRRPELGDVAGAPVSKLRSYRECYQAASHLVIYALLIDVASCVLCASVCWTHRRDLQKRLNRSRCCLVGRLVWTPGTTRRIRLNDPCGVGRRCGLMPNYCIYLLHQNFYKSNFLTDRNRIVVLA